jgi:hypothetical protein
MACKSAQRLFDATLAVLVLVVTSTVLTAGTASADTRVLPACYNGVAPLQPFVQSCTLPSNQPRVRGAAPDPGAIIACRHHPGCLSYVVNGP